MKNGMKRKHFNHHDDDCYLPELSVQKMLVLFFQNARFSSAQTVITNLYIHVSETRKLT